jgi:hypothetical protein
MAESSFTPGWKHHSSGTSSMVMDGRASPSRASMVEWKCQGASRCVPLCVVSVTHSAAAASPSG